MAVDSMPVGKDGKLKNILELINLPTTMFMCSAGNNKVMVVSDNILNHRKGKKIKKQRICLNLKKNKIK